MRYILAKVLFSIFLAVVFLLTSITYTGKAEIDTSIPSGNGENSVDLYSCFISAGNYYSIDPYLLMSISWVESKFNPGALNRNRDGSYDMGIMQINTRWKNYLRRYGIDLSHLWDPCYNIYIGAMILRYCIDNHGYNWRAVDCYNRGVRRAKGTSRYVWKVYYTLKRYAQFQTASQLYGD